MLLIFTVPCFVLFQSRVSALIINKEIFMYLNETFDKNINIYPVHYFIIKQLVTWFYQFCMPNSFVLSC